MARGRWLIPLVFLLAAAAVLHVAENLHLNPKLNYLSDTQDGPLIASDRMEEGAVPGKPNYIIIHSEG